MAGDPLHFTAAEARLVERHPLPEGVPDALVNKAQLAAALGVSQVTVSNWLHRPPGASPVDPDGPVPFEQEGTNGRSYQFRLSVAHAWNAARQAAEKARDAAAEEAAAQLKLALVGQEGFGAGQEGLSLSEQRQILELEHHRAVAARDRGDLVRRGEVVGGFEEVFAAIRDALDALPDRLGREIGAEGRDLERIEAACDDALAGAVRKVEGLIGEDAAGDISGGAAAGVGDG